MQVLHHHARTYVCSHGVSLPCAIVLVQDAIEASKEMQNSIILILAPEHSG